MAMTSIMHPSFSRFENLETLEKDIATANIGMLKLFERRLFGSSESEDLEIDLRRQKLNCAICNERTRRAAVAWTAGPAQVIDVQVDEIDVDVGMLWPVVPDRIWRGGLLASSDAAVVREACTNWMGVENSVVQSVKECMTRAVFGMTVDGFSGRANPTYIILRRGTQCVFAKLHARDVYGPVSVYYGNMATDTDTARGMKDAEQRRITAAHERAEAARKAAAMQSIVDDVSVAEDGICRRNVHRCKMCDGRACRSRRLMYEEPFMTTSDPSRVRDSIDLCELCFDDPEGQKQCDGVAMASALMQFRPMCCLCDEPVQLDCEYFVLDCQFDHFQNACSKECVLKHGLDPTRLGVKQVNTVRLTGHRGGTAHPILSTRVIRKFSVERRRDARI